MMNFFKLILVLVPMALGISGCNTVEGAGQDLENLGEEIEEEAD